MAVIIGRRELLATRRRDGIAARGVGAAGGHRISGREHAFSVEQSHDSRDILGPCRRGDRIRG